MTACGGQNLSGTWEWEDIQGGWGTGDRREVLVISGSNITIYSYRPSFRLAGDFPFTVVPITPGDNEELVTIGETDWIRESVSGTFTTSSDQTGNRIEITIDGNVAVETFVRTDNTLTIGRRQYTRR